MTTGPTQFLAFRFGSDSRFEGQLVGAPERIESGGTVRVLDGLFVAREPQSGELESFPGPWDWDVKRLAASMLVVTNSSSRGMPLAPEPNMRRPARPGGCSGLIADGVRVCRSTC
jgi:hypothetical protein